MSLSHTPELPARPDRRPAILVATAMAAVGGGSAATISPASAAVFAVVGLLWGLGLVFVTGKLNRSESRGWAWQNATIIGTVLVGGLLIGASVASQLLMGAALSDAPQVFADLLRGPVGAAQKVPFFLFNMLLEWLFIPAVLLINWSLAPRRRLLTVGLVVFYASRLWTYLYFAPLILSWSEGRPGTPLTADQLEHARFWVDLSWFRVALDLIAIGLAVLATFVPAQRSQTAPSIGYASRRV